MERETTFIQPLMGSKVAGGSGYGASRPLPWTAASPCSLANKYSLRMHRALQRTRMIAVQPILYGYLSYIAGSTTQVLTFFVNTVAREVKMYRIYLQFYVCFLDAVDVLKYWRRIRKNVRIYQFTIYIYLLPIVII